MIPNDVIDAYYAEMTPCPGCAAKWRPDDDGNASIDHIKGCALLAQFDADE